MFRLILAILLIPSICSAYTGYFSSVPYRVLDGRTIYARDLNNPMAAISTGIGTLVSNIQTGQGIYTATDTGVSNAYVMNLTVTPVALADGLEVWMKPAVSNNGPSTLNLNSFGVKSIRNPDGSALTGGELTSGYYSHLKYNGTYWQITSNTARNVVDEDLISYSVSTISELADVSPIQQAVVVESRSSSGDFGGGIFIWNGSNLSSHVSMDPLNGVFVPHSSDPTGAGGAWVRAFDGDVNARWFGATGDGATDDTEELQGAINYCGYENKKLFIQTGTYKTTSPLTVTWGSSTSIPGIYGDGYDTVLYGTISTAGRAVLELIGSSNTVSVNTEIKNFRILMTGGSEEAYCLRVGDAKNAFLAERIWLDGANGVLLKISSTVGYAQVNTIFRQVFIISNYNNNWFADDADATVYSLRDESGGASWDNVLFESCIFGGMVKPRATIARFSNCQFSTNPNRPEGYNSNIFVNIGNLFVDHCYFEDHYEAIKAQPTISNIKLISITNSHFSGASNYGGVGQRAINLYAYGDYKIFNTTIKDCEFGDDSYALEAIRNISEGYVEISGCVNFETPENQVSILNEAPNFRITNATTQHNSEQISFSRTLAAQANSAVLMYITRTGTLGEYYIDRDSWISKIELFIDKQMTSGYFSVLVQKNGTTIGTFPITDFTRRSTASGEVLVMDLPFQISVGSAAVFNSTDILAIRLTTATLLPNPGLGNWNVYLNATIVH